MTSYRSLTFDPQGPVARITLTRPDILNRVDNDSIDEIADVIERLRRPGEARVAIFASTGTIFSAGGDLAEVERLHSDKQHRERAWDTGRRIIHGLADIPIPLIFAVQGDVFGLGATIVLAGDVIVASRNVRIGDPHVKVGLVAGDGGCLVWPAAFGSIRARRHLLTGDPINADDAHMLGGVTDLVETPDEVLPAAEGIAARIAALPPMAVQFTKRAFNHSTRRQAADVFELSLVLEQYGLLSEDLLEAVDAFRNKRAPTYRNR